MLSLTVIFENNNITIPYNHVLFKKIHGLNSVAAGFNAITQPENTGTTAAQYYYPAGGRYGLWRFAMLWKSEDFYKQKIMYPNMTKYLPFYLDNNGFVQNDKSFMITGKNIAFLTAFLNSSVFKYCFIDNFPELQGGTRELRKIFLDKIPVLKVSSQTNKDFEKLVLELQDLVAEQKPTKELEIRIDEKIFDLYSLTKEEKRTIGFIEIQ